MSQVKTIPAIQRDRAGKGAARAARRNGYVPAVIYGNKTEPSMISLEQRIAVKELKTGAFLTTIYDIQLGDKSEHVLPRDIQLDPITDLPIHVDFLRVSDTTKINVMVPVVFKNEEEAPGLIEGGVLNVVRHEIEILCSANRIPTEIEVDLTGLTVGDSVHFSQVSLPQGATPAIQDRDFTIATIAAPSAMRSQAEEEAAAEAEAAEEAAAEEGEGEGESEAGEGETGEKG